MPPKLHKKFGDASAPSPPPTTNGNSSSQSKSTNPSSTNNASKASPLPSQGNGLKRSQDGNPKSNTPSVDSQSSRASNAGKSQQASGHDDSGRARKLPKLSALDSKKSEQSENLSQQQHGAKVNGALHAKRTYNNMPSEQDLRHTAKSLEKARLNLPVYRKKLDIRWALRKHDVLIINGETGSGKSTQIPQFLYTEPWCVRKMVKVEENDGKKNEMYVGGMIAITQPRRIAAITLAGRVAAEMGSPLTKGSVASGQQGTVGYSVRFDHKVPKGTKIKFVTEGVLLQEMLTDPHLRKYSAVIIDEIHERSMDVDLIAGFLRKMVHGDKQGRGGVPLKVVIMSATLDKGGIEAFFAKPGTVPDYIPGQNHGRTLAPHMLENMALQNNDVAGKVLDKKIDKKSKKGKDKIGAEVLKAYGSPKSSTKENRATEGSDSRRSSTDSGFSSWSGITDSTVATQAAAKLQASEDEFKEACQIEGSPSKENHLPLSRPGIPEGDISENGVAYEYIAGRQYEVKSFFELQPQEDYQRGMLEAILMLHTSEPLPGDILAFLTGQEEIESLQAELEKYSAMLNASVPKMEIKPLHGSLTPDQQQDAFTKTEKKFTRKVVLATNIAETSVTVAGVRYVVDCGKAKVKQYRPTLGMESLLIKPISQVSAIQRAGRAGREAKGKCHRIYTKADFAKMEQDETPEILRCDVIEAVLKMKARGVNDVLDFPLMDSPDVIYMSKALNRLYEMDALNPDSTLTKIGNLMAGFPLPATHGRVMIASADESADCLLEVIDILACLNSDKQIFLLPKDADQQEEIADSRSDITRREGDLITLLTTMQRYASENTNRRMWCEKRKISGPAMGMAMSIRKQLRQQCFEKKLLKEIPPADPQPFEPVTPEKAKVIIKMFLKAFVRETAILASDGSYKTTTSSGKDIIAIHPSSVLHGKKLEAIMFLQHQYTAKNYALKVSSIQADWIAEQYGLC